MTDTADIHRDDAGNPLLDEQGNTIPLTICLCFAHTPTECACSTTCWANYTEDYEDIWNY
jgi:hypothetical protein